MKETINGIPVEITRKKIKTLRITVTRQGIVKVSAPLFINADIIKRFVTSKSEWITDRQKRFIELSACQNEVREGGEALLWGKKYPIRIILGQKIKCDFNEELIVITKPDSCIEYNLTLVLERLYRKKLQNRIEKRLPFFEELTGLKCSGWSIRKMVSRWGSCNIKTKTLCFSLNLAKYPYECLDYVILHELLHIAVPNHGTQFKTLLSRYCPDWKSIRKQLNG